MRRILHQNAWITTLKTNGPSFSLFKLMLVAGSEIEKQEIISLILD